jgi:hypothetical protein
MRGVGAIVLVVVASACGPTATPIRGPDGTQWWSIACRHSQSECWAKAGDVCPRGYETADQSGGTTGATAINTGYTTTVVTHYRGEMLIRCKRRHVVPSPPTVRGPENGWEPADDREEAPLGRECLDDNSCETGQRCAFATGASSVGHCTPAK